MRLSFVSSIGARAVDILPLTGWPEWAEIHSCSSSSVEKYEKLSNLGEHDRRRPIDLREVYFEPNAFHGRGVVGWAKSRGEVSNGMSCQACKQDE